MHKLLKTSLLTITIVLLTLSLSACGKDEKSKPAAEKSAPAQATQPAIKSEAPTPVTPPPTATATINPTPKPKTAPVLQSAVQPASTGHEKMLKLARKSGCLSCHMVDKKMVGPAWKDVATRYKGKAGARALLIEKVSKGGRGNWKEVVGNAAMPPYFPRVSKENIGKLVDFVLSLQ